MGAAEQQQAERRLKALKEAKASELTTLEGKVKEWQGKAENMKTQYRLEKSLDLSGHTLAEGSWRKSKHNNRDECIRDNLHEHGFHKTDIDKAILGKFGDMDRQ